MTILLYNIDDDDLTVSKSLGTAVTLNDVNLLTDNEEIEIGRVSCRERV